MAKKKAAPVVEEPEEDLELDVDLDDLEIEEEDDVDEDAAEEIEETPVVEPAPKRGRAKKEPKEKPAKTRAEVDMNGTLGTREVANMVGVEPRQLRAVLREHFYADNSFTRYAWVEGSAELKQILDYFAAKASAPKVERAPRVRKAKEEAPPAEVVEVAPPAEPAAKKGKKAK